jgi:hypothetical protein
LSTRSAKKGPDDAFGGILTRLKTFHNTDKKTSIQSPALESTKNIDVPSNVNDFLPAATYQPKKFVFSEASVSHENEEALISYLNGIANEKQEENENIDSLINTDSVSEFSKIFESSNISMHGSVDVLEGPINNTRIKTTTLLNQKSFINQDYSKGSKVNNIPASLPSKNTFTINSVLTQFPTEIHSKKSRNVASQKPPMKNKLGPLVPKEFIDPLISVAERQMAQWEKMKLDMNTRYGTIASKKFRKISSIIEVVQALRELGMSPSLVVLFELT